MFKKCILPIWVLSILLVGGCNRSASEDVIPPTSTSTLFYVTVEVTRVEVVEKVITATPLPVTSSPTFTPTPIFQDVGYDNPDKEAIEWASQSGLIKPWNDGLFHPDEPLTRGVRVCALAIVCSGTDDLPEPVGYFMDLDLRLPDERRVAECAEELVRRGLYPEQFWCKESGNFICADEFFYYFPAQDWSLAQGWIDLSLESGCTIKESGDETTALYGTGLLSHPICYRPSLAGIGQIPNAASCCTSQEDCKNWYGKNYGCTGTGECCGCKFGKDEGSSGPWQCYDCSGNSYIAKKDWAGCRAKEPTAVPPPATLTYTPAPTNTPKPTPTYTPVPTNTPEPPPAKRERRATDTPESVYIAPSPTPTATQSACTTGMGADGCLLTRAMEARLLYEAFGPGATLTPSP